MTLQKTNWIKAVLLSGALASISGLVACGGSSYSGGGTNNPPPAISVSVGSSASSIQVNATANITATVSNDSASAGVTWTVTCGSTGAGACGAVNPTTTASGTATVFTAPATVPTGNTVTITATSVTDTTKSGSATVTITAASNGVSVQLTTRSAASLTLSGTASVAATVTNDPANAGVTWTVTCGSTGVCGSFNPTSTASAVATTYTAPAAVPTGNTVTITATSVTDTTQSASQNVVIANPAAALGTGNYVFSLTGEDTFTNGPYFLSGVITIASGGVITGGEQDFVDYNQFAASDLINPTGSTITTTADGNLQIILTTCNGTDCTTTDTSIGVNGVETLNGSLVSSSRGLIIEFDSSASSSGTLDLQTSTAAPSGGYAFGITGLDTNAFPIFIGGVLNIDSPGNISGTGSVFDANDGGTLFPSESLSASSFSGPDTLGRVTFTLNPVDTTDFATIALVGYIVDSGHIRLVETLDNFLATTGGTALGQTGTGAFTSASISGTSYVFGSSGADSNVVLQLAGLLTFNSDLSVSGNASFNDFSFQSPQGGATLASGGTYSVDASGTGRVTVSNLTDNSTFVNPYTLELYLTGDGHAVVISMDTTDGLYGLAFQQSGAGAFTAGSLAGDYSLNVDQQDTTGVFEYDGVGTVSLDGVSSLTGFLDITGILNSPLTPVSNDLVAGSFTANASGVFTGTIQGISDSSGSTADNFTYYLVDGTKGFGIENDADQLTLGYFEVQ